jgi:parallel beta-helix repeat protein
LVVEDSEAMYNKVNGSGGFLVIGASGSRVAYITNTKIINNVAGIQGGGIWATNVNLTVQNSHIEGNQCIDNGGGIFMSMGKGNLFGEFT